MDTKRGRGQIKEERECPFATPSTPSHEDSRGGNTISTWKIYARQILVVGGSLIDSKTGESKALEAKVTFSNKDVVRIHLHNDDPVVMII